MRRRLVLAALTATVALVAACESERAIITSPAGARAYGTTLGLASTNLPRGSVRFPAPATAPSTTLDSVVVTLLGLDSLADARYVVWVVDSAATTGQPARFRRLRGIVTQTYTDTVTNKLGDPEGQTYVQTFANVDSFNLRTAAAAPTRQGIGARTVTRFVTNRALSGLAVSDSIQTILVSIEKDGAATTPSATRRFLWARRADAAAAVAIGGRNTRTGSLVFGNFTVNRDSMYVFTPGGSGRVYVRDDVIIVNDSSLPRPPLGFYYATYALKRDSVNAAIDTIFLGAQHSPYPRRNISLIDADSVQADPEAQVDVIPSNYPGSWARPSPRAILFASTRASSDTIAALVDPKGKKFAGIAQIFVSLESKNALQGRLGPAIVFRADLPNIVRNPPQNPPQ
ncbi:MAG: hypothetical protein WKG32_07695 [Gemmatimonadaceae bacterium]